MYHGSQMAQTGVFPTLRKGIGVVDEGIVKEDVFSGFTTI